MATMVHGGTLQNMTPAFEGLAAVLNSKASVTEITNILKKCTKIRDSENCQSRSSEF